MSSLNVDIQLTIGSFSLNVELEAGDTPLAVIGPNGSGKSTLLRALVGALPLDSGSIVLRGRKLYDSKTAIDVPPEGRRVGYLPQGFGLFPHLNVVDNVAFGLSLGERRKLPGDRRAVALKILEGLEAASLAQRAVQRLSGGEQQRVALARALAIEPELLLLDEPLSALDVAARQGVRRFLVKQIKSLARPAIFTTHDVRDVVALEAQVLVLDAGRIVQQGSIEELKRNPGNEFVSEFCGLSD